MATVYVTEFGRVGAGEPAHIPVAQMPWVATQVVVIGATSVQSAVFQASTKLVRVHPDSICSINIGVNPVATANSLRMEAGQTEYFWVPAGMRIAVITNS
jgi:hypothetical protein